MTRTIEDIYELMIEYNIATEEEINLITCINGYNTESLEDIIFVRTGYHNIDDCLMGTEV